MGEPDWNLLFEGVRERYRELEHGSERRLQRFLDHVKNLRTWENDGLPDATMEAVAAAAIFPNEISIAFATCNVECGIAEFIIDGSTQECQRCGRNMFRHEVKYYRVADGRDSTNN